jgi:hypothetical protein
LPIVEIVRDMVSDFNLNSFQKDLVRHMKDILSFFARKLETYMVKIWDAIGR